MPRDHGMNIYYECDITNWHVDMRALITWCEQHVEGGWNVVADGGPQPVRGGRVHRVILLFDKQEDMTAVQMHWQ